MGWHRAEQTLLFHTSVILHPESAGDEKRRKAPRSTAALPCVPHIRPWPPC